MEKTSREYAEKMASEIEFTLEEPLSAFETDLVINGYLKAVEETNVKEKDRLLKLMYDFFFEGYEDDIKEFEQLKQLRKDVELALQKAKEIK